MLALGSSFVIGGLGNLQDQWGQSSTALRTGSVVLVLGVTAFSLLFSACLLRCGVFVTGGQLVVRQLSRTRRFDRVDLRSAAISSTVNLLRPAAVLDLKLAGDRSVRCQLYGRYLRRSRADQIAEFLNSWVTTA